MAFARLLAWLLVGAASLPAGAQEKLPSFDELEAAGAVIGEIRVVTEDIFDLTDPKEDNWLFRTANRLHATSQPALIRAMLLFKSGDRLQHRLIDETERVIRGASFVYEATIRPIRYENNVVDLEVRTRDTWTLQPSASLSRSGGKSTGRLSLKEENLAGTGTAIELERTREVERTGSHVRLAHEHLFDGWTRLSFDRASFTDGSRLELGAARPFYSLDTRWAAAANYARFEQTDSVYRNGEVVGDYRHERRAYNVSGGWSPGRVGRWTQRLSSGVDYAEDDYAPDPANPPPFAIPVSRTLAGPFVRYEVIEDEFLEVTNRERIRKIEYLQMGWSSSVQLGRSLTAFGANDQPWLVNAALSKGFHAGDGQLLASASYSGQHGSQLGDMRSLGSSLRLYAPHPGNFLFFASASLNTVKTASPADELLLGGDNGVRGYPLRYQSGTKRAVFTLEERYYTDWYPLRLFRVGWAVYYDVGRAWGGALPNATPGWLSNVGFGLRIASARASFGNVLHIDLAFPVHRTDPNIKPRQLVVMAGKTF